MTQLAQTLRIQLRWLPLRTRKSLLNRELFSAGEPVVIRIVAVFVDEAAKIKNPEAEVTQAFHRLSGLFSKRVIMTGTHCGEWPPGAKPVPDVSYSAPTAPANPVIRAVLSSSDVSSRSVLGRGNPGDAFTRQERLGYAAQL